MNAPQTDMDSETQDLAGMLADSARDYLARGYGEAVRAASLAHRDGCAPERWREFADLGWLGLALPETDGGLAGDTRALGVVAEALGAALVVEPFGPCAVLAAGLAADLPASAERAALLDGVAEGRRRLAFAPWEAGVGQDATRVRMQAEAPGSEGTAWRLHGAKSVAPGAAGADAVLMVAWLADGAEQGLFALAADAPGLQVQATALYDGSHAARIACAGAPATLLLRAAPDAMAQRVARALQRATIVHAADTLGAARRAFEITTDYLRTRKQFGKPIASNQVIQHRLVDLYVEIAELRALTDATAAAFDADAPGLATSVAALRACTAIVARHVWEESVQLHGAIGMTDEYVVGQYVKRLALACTLYGGMEEQLEVVAASALD